MKEEFQEKEERDLLVTSTTQPAFADELQKPLTDTQLFLDDPSPALLPLSQGSQLKLQCKTVRVILHSSTFNGFP